MLAVLAALIRDLVFGTPNNGDVPKWVTANSRAEWGSIASPNLAAVLAAGNDAGLASISNVGVLTAVSADIHTVTITQEAATAGLIISTRVSAGTNPISLVNDDTDTDLFSVSVTGEILGTTFGGIGGEPFVLVSQVNIAGHELNLNDGSGTGGGNINMDGGNITNTVILFFENGLAIGGSSVHVSLNLPASDFIGNPVNMNDGSGSGGNSLSMDGGSITNCNSLTTIGPLTIGSQVATIVLSSNLDASGFHIDMAGGEIKSMRAGSFIGNPSSPNPGQIYYDAGDNHFYGYNGSSWVQLDN